jgi:hypothetical protein
MQTESYGASMQVMARESWTDERLDDLNAKVDRGFERVDRRFEQVDRRFEQVDEEFKAVRREIKEGFETLHHSLVVATSAIFGGTFAGFAGLIATQL